MGLRIPHRNRGNLCWNTRNRGSASRCAGRVRRAAAPTSGCYRRASERPEQALEDIDPGVLTLVNRLLILLDAPEAGGKQADAQLLLVLPSEAAPEGSGFEMTSARTPDGSPVVPQSTQGPYWELLVK